VTARMDQHFGVIAAAALEAIQSHADFLRTERLGARCNMRRQDCEDGSHFGVLAAAASQAVQSTANKSKRRKQSMRSTKGARARRNARTLVSSLLRSTKTRQARS